MKAVLTLLCLLVVGCAPVAAGRDADFLDRLRPYCGQAFEGRIVSPPVEADATFAGKRLVMHVRQCSDGEVRIPFHVGDDHSRTWVLTRLPAAIRLKHDHRHRDGSEDRVTQYGGDATSTPSDPRQTFPADDFTKALLRREGNVAGVHNVWTMAIADDRFAYELRRPGRFFRVEFDLRRPVPAPPAPWGS